MNYLRLRTNNDSNIKIILIKMLIRRGKLAVLYEQWLYFLCNMKKHDDLLQAELNNIGDRIRELRIASGFSSYEKFAFTHDIDRSQFGRYENGSDMRLSSFIRVLKALDVDWLEFFNDEFKKQDE